LKSNEKDLKIINEGRLLFLKERKEKLMQNNLLLVGKKHTAQISRGKLE
jgi:hypothetical protein